MTTDRKSVEATLSNADFPASKEQLVAHAEAYGTHEPTVRALRAMPPADYANVDEVVRSVPTEEGQSSSDKAQQARQRGTHGLAEHETEIPANPIVEELGENRGS